MNKTMRALIFWTVIAASAYALWYSVKADSTSRTAPEISYSSFMTKVAEDQVTRVEIAGNLVRGVDVKGNAFRVVAPPNQLNMIQELQQHRVDIWLKDNPANSGLPQLLANCAPLILLAVLWFFMVRKMKTAWPQRYTGQEPSSSGPSPRSQPRFGP